LSKNFAFLFFSSSSQKIRSSFWAREFAASTTPPPTTTTREDLRVSDPGASRSSRFVSLDFRARALRKDA
jgi:hypothetical protein